MRNLTRYYFYLLLFLGISLNPNNYSWSSTLVSNKNIRDVSQILSRKDAAAFALLAYHDEANNPDIPDGFTLLCQCPIEMQSKNYYGEAYYRIDYAYYSDGRKIPAGVTVVIAHRGTILTKDNLEDDLQVALKIAPDAYFTGSKPFTNYVSSLVYSKFPYKEGFFTHHFVHVGHSLGAIHAELNYVSQRKNEWSDNMFATTFESPGSKEIMTGLISIGELSTSSLYWASSIEIINTDVNAINSFNEQAGIILWIRPGYHFTHIPKIDFPPTDFKYFLTAFTLDQHSMLNIYKFLKNDGQIDNVGSFPVGINNAYKYYLTYFPSLDNAHRDYWNEAFKDYWDNHSEIHAEYNNDFINYRDYEIKHHLYS